MNSCPDIVQTNRRRRTRIAGTFALVISILASFFLDRVVSAFSEISLIGSHAAFQQLNSQHESPPAPQHNYAQRINLGTGQTREIVVSEVIVSALSIDPDTAAVAVNGDHNLFITGLRPGTTILIISSKNSHTIYAVDVKRPSIVRGSGLPNQNLAQLENASGSNSLYFTAGFKGGPSLLRHTFEYSQKLRNNRTLQMGSEIFHFFGAGDRGLTLPLGARFGANRLKLSFGSPTTKLDLLDSELEISPLGLNGYTLRGLHFVSRSNSRWHGLELFAGSARPQLTLFNQGEGSLAGAIIPVVYSEALRIRSGMFFIRPRHSFGSRPQLYSASGQRGGLVLQTDARYSPDDTTNVEGELAYANEGFSWRARLDLQRGPIKFYGERSHLDQRSPMIVIGAQAAGRTRSAFNLQWQVSSRFGTGVSYNRTNSAPLVRAGRIELNSRTFLVSTTFTPTGSARLRFSFNEQLIDAPAPPPVSFLFNLRTRSAVIKYDQRINYHWKNNLEARVIQSREVNTNAPLNRGISLREQMHYTWRLGSVTAFMTYRSNTPSLDSLILRNPALLPVEFRAAFAADPQRFLLTNRDELPLLLTGVDLPVSSNRETGVRIQSALARLAFAGELVYGIDKFMVGEQRSLRTTWSANLKLDPANDIQVSATRVFGFSGTYNQTAFTVGYVHRFGASSGGGFQFDRFLGLRRGRIQGRVFLDSNGNGQEDLGEKGLPGMKVQLDGSKSVITDAHGTFDFGPLPAGDFDIALMSDDLGVTLRASRPITQHLSLSPHETKSLSFGLTNTGFVSGRIFNDLFLTGERSAADAPGLAGVKIILRPASTDLTMPGSTYSTQIVSGSGQFEFRNLAPGPYMLEIEAQSLPANFQLPASLSSTLMVEPLQGTYIDIPLVAQRAISGMVFIDHDGDGKFDHEKDEMAANANIFVGGRHTATDSNGEYILRNLPAGRIEVQARHSGKSSQIVIIQLPPEPLIRRGVNLAIIR